MPSVSVVIPTHNRPNLLKAALASVRAQTFSNFEIIVVDDGNSGTATGEVVASFTDPRIRIVRTPHPHSGGGAARNRGVAEARTPLLAFLDDDDEWLPQKLERQLDAMAHASPGTAYCFSSVLMDYGDKEVVNSVENGEGNFAERALRRFSGTMTSSLIVRRDAFLEIGGFDESFSSHQEAELMIRLTERYHGLGIAEPLVRMKVEAGREHIGGNIDRRIRGREMLLAKHARRYTAYPALLARHKYWLAFLYRDAGRRVDALRALREAWSLDRRSAYLLRYWILRLTCR